MKTEPKKSFFGRMFDFLRFEEKDDDYYEDEYYEKLHQGNHPKKIVDEPSLKNPASKRPIYPEYEEDEEDLEIITTSTSTIPPVDDTPKEPDDHILGVDVFETRDSIYVIAFTAGARRNDLSITLSRTTIIIQGERQLPYFSGADSSFHSQELQWGHFSREIILPEEVEIDFTDAKEENGLLTVKLTKVDRQKTARIKVV